MGFVTSGTKLRVRIVKQPNVRDAELDGFDLATFQVGGIYDVGPRLADYLIVSGYAILEMRFRDRAQDKPETPRDS